MDRLAALFEQLPVPEIARLLRRTAFSAIGVGVVLLVTAAILGHSLAGLGACLGLGIGLVNIRLITRSVARLSEAGTAHPRRILAQRSIARLGMTTVIVVGLAVASVQLGLGAFAGVALFYFVLLANVVRSLLHQPGITA